MLQGNRRLGFTLVELSIVLVIIGLLIGGLLVAQSMISTARVQKTVRNIQQFDSGLNNFKTTYKGLPGDSAIFGCTVGGGPQTNACNNGIIEDRWGNLLATPSMTGDFNGEAANFWPSLQAAGFTSNEFNLVYDAVASAGSFSIKLPSQQSPQLPIGRNTGIVPQYDTYHFATASNGGHFWLTGDFSANDHSSIYFSAPLPLRSISAADAAALDAKMDNGSAGDAVGQNIASEDVFDYAPNSNNCSTAGQYNVNNSNAGCQLSIRMKIY